MSQDARRDEEQRTARRALVLRMDYIDTTLLNKVLYKDILSVPELREYRAMVLRQRRHKKQCKC